MPLLEKLTEVYGSREVLPQMSASSADKDREKQWKLILLIESKKGPRIVLTKRERLAKWALGKERLYHFLPEGSGSIKGHRDSILLWLKVQFPDLELPPKLKIIEVSGVESDECKVYVCYLGELKIRNLGLSSFSLPRKRKQTRMVERNGRLVREKYEVWRNVVWACPQTDLMIILHFFS